MLAIGFLQNEILSTMTVFVLLPTTFAGWTEPVQGSCGFLCESGLGGRRGIGGFLVVTFFDIGDLPWLRLSFVFEGCECTSDGPLSPQITPPELAAVFGNTLADKCEGRARTKEAAVWPDIQGKLGPPVKV